MTIIWGPMNKYGEMTIGKLPESESGLLRITADCPGARLTARTACTVCGETPQSGQRWTAYLAVPPEDGTWRHEQCPTDKEADDE